MKYVRLKALIFVSRICRCESYQAMVYTKNALLDGGSMSVPLSTQQPYVGVMHMRLDPGNEEV
jgi:hypothetical protein